MLKIINALSSSEITFLIIITALALSAAVVLIIVAINNAKYKTFVRKHSVAYKSIREINKRYQFHTFPNYTLTHRYDNRNFYNEISCQDYLTYELVYKKDIISELLDDVESNRIMLVQYKADVAKQCQLNHFDTPELLPNKNKLLKIEKRLIDERIKKPRTDCAIIVTLILTNINGAFRGSKKQSFSEHQIRDIMSRLRQKTGYYYRDNEIWASICRVERGKVTNKMRFAIYNRDHYRCRKCGRRTNDLEIDHIIPIAKGGKSTFDNLQTLCHRCNVKKGSDIEY